MTATHLRGQRDSKYGEPIARGSVVTETVLSALALLFLHHGIWHGGGANRSDRMRYMFKMRLAPQRPQQRLWDTSDLDTQTPQRPIFWLSESVREDDVATHLTRNLPWHEQDTGRLEHLNAIRFWRYLTGDEKFDADCWLTRVENEPQ